MISLSPIDWHRPTNINKNYQMPSWARSAHPRKQARRAVSRTLSGGWGEKDSFFFLLRQVTNRVHLPSRACNLPNRRCKGVWDRRNVSLPSVEMRTAALKNLLRSREWRCPTLLPIRCALFHASTPSLSRRSSDRSDSEVVAVSPSVLGLIYLLGI